MKNYYVYILASSKNGTLYTGVTNDLMKRVQEHKDKILKGFTEKYEVDKLVYYETYKYINEAIQREKNIKKWYRGWKLNLIEQGNPEWIDLHEEIINSTGLNTGFPPARE